METPSEVRRAIYTERKPIITQENLDETVESIAALIDDLDTFKKEMKALDVCQCVPEALREPLATFFKVNRDWFRMRLFGSKEAANV